MPRILFLLLLCPLMIPPLAAEPATPRIIALNLCCLRHAGGVRTLNLKSDAVTDPAEVRVYQGGFTDPVPTLVENGKIVVYKPGGDGQAPWVPAWSFAVPANGTAYSAILLPMPPKDNPSAPYTAFVLPSENDFAYGSVLAINLTTLGTNLELGRKKLPLPPGGHNSAALASEADSYNMVAVTASIQNDGKWFTLHTTRWAYNVRCRQVAIFWMDPAAHRPEITSIREVRPMAAPKE